MNCPKCGSTAPPDQKFCRSCGASIRIGTQPTVAPTPIAGEEVSVQFGAKDEISVAYRSVFWAFVVTFIGVAIGVIGKMLLHVEAVTVIGVLLSLAGMFFVAYPYLVPPRRIKRVLAPSPSPEILFQAEPTRRLPQASDIDNLPSVTEGTTDLLKVPVAIKQSSKHDEIS